MLTQFWVQKSPVEVAYKLSSPALMSSKHFLPSMFTSYCRFLQKNSSSSTVSREQWSSIVHVQSRPPFSAPFVWWNIRWLLERLPLTKIFSSKVQIVQLEYLHEIKHFWNLRHVQALLHVNSFHFLDLNLGRTASVFLSINIRSATQHQASIEQDQWFSHAAQIYSASYESSLVGGTLQSLTTEKAPAQIFTTRLPGVLDLSTMFFIYAGFSCTGRTISLNSNFSLYHLCKYSSCGGLLILRNWLFHSECVLRHSSGAA